MLALVDHTHNGGSAGNRLVNLRQIVVSDDPRPLSEWLQCVPKHRDGRLGLHCVANVSWLRRDGEVSMRGALSESRYSFVTFRLVRTNGQYREL